MYRRTVTTGAQTLLASINITETHSDMRTYMLGTEFTIASDEMLVVGEPNTTGSFYFTNAGGDGFWSRVVNASTSMSLNNRGISLCVDVGYINEAS